MSFPSNYIICFASDLVINKIKFLINGTYIYYWVKKLLKGEIKVYDSNQKQYILKESSGKVWNFFYDERLGLCYSLLTKRNTWTEPISLQKSMHPSFYVDIDYNDQLYILFQDKLGNILCSFFKKDEIKTLSVLNSKSPIAYNKHLLLIPAKSAIHIFFVIEYNSKMILSHQTFSGGAVSLPRPIDYVPNSEFPYSVVCDNTGNIYAFYQCSDGKHYQIGYKKYMASQKFWGEFTPVTRFNGESEFPRTIIDHKNIIHICYQRRSSKQYELVYQQKIPDKNIWTNEYVIYSSPFSFSGSSLAYINDNIYVFWVRENNIFYSNSNDDGSTWSKPVRYNALSGRQLLCLSYRTNNPYEKEKIISSDIPGNFINGFNLAFYQDPTGNMKNLSFDELKNMIVDSLKLLKNSIEDLKESDANKNDDIYKLKLSQQTLEKELSKYTIKMSLLEKEINKLKQMNILPEGSRENTNFYQGFQPNQSPNETDSVPENALESNLTVHDFKDLLHKKKLKLNDRVKNREFVIKHSK